MAQTVEHSQIRDRYAYIDLLKVLAIVFVLLYHTTNLTYDFLAEENNLLYYLRYYLRTILSTCVPLFFFVNGFLLFSKPLNLKKHIRKSIRLVVLTFVWGIITTLILTVIRGQPMSLQELFVSVWEWQFGWTHHLWYMGALVCLYVFFPLLKTAFDHQQTVFSYFIAITAVLTFGNTALNHAGTIVLQNEHGSSALLAYNWFNMFNPFRDIPGYAFVYFCVGGCAKEFVKVIQENRQKSNWIASISMLASMGLLCALAVTLAKLSGTLWDIVWCGYDTIFTFVNVVCLFVLCTNYKGKRAKGLISLLSANTLGVYLIHYPYVYWLESYVEKMPFLSNVAGNMLFAAVVLCISLLSALLIKKIPLLKHLL